MPQLKFKPAATAERYPADVTRIVAACLAQGYEITRCDAVLAWEAYSEGMCAGWMMPELYSNPSLCEIVRQYCEES